MTTYSANGPLRGTGHYSFQPSSQNSGTELALLAEEVPLAIHVHGVLHAIMMVSPLHCDDFITGFALSEGLIRHAGELTAVHLRHGQQPAANIHADLTLSSDRFRDFLQQQRTARRGTAGCGLCGTDSLQQIFPDLPPLNGRPFSLPDSDLRELLSQHQVLGHESGAVHAALLLSADAEPLLMREDVGRHNALDKVIGAALRQQRPLTGCTVLMSSRCSTELILKAVRAGLSGLIHLAAPSTLAVQMARHYNLALVQVPRHDAPRFFHHPGHHPTINPSAQESADE